MGIDPFLIQPLALVFEDQHGIELVGADLIERNADAQLQRGPEIERAADQQAGLARLRSVEFIEWAMVAAATVLWRVGTQPRIAQLLAPQRPVDQEAEGGPIRPLPVQKFGSRSS
jgi:hypothetical protein